MNSNKKYPLLVSCEWLEKNYKLPHIRIFDCTVYLPPQPDKIYKIISGRSEYNKEHIPNSDFLDILSISDKNSSLNFMMPSTDLFESFMSSKGVGADTHIILYSRENIQWATRVWWMLKSVSYDNVSILNGGFDRWKLEDKITSSFPVNYKTNNFKAKKKKGYFCRKDEIIKSINNNRISLINGLRSTLYYGKEPINYGRPGHIKNSISIPSTKMIDEETKLYKSNNALKKIFSNANVLNKDKVIAYCGAGIAATNIAFALNTIGFYNVTVYDASLSEWAKDDKLPMSL
tara:strand:+ start:97 stop:963 length:867 start_codon:yes stop_codon:yes gene_type:complete